MNLKKEYRGEITMILDERELLEQLAEESVELGKAALKMIRAEGMSDNVTPVSAEQAMLDLREETIDVMMVLDCLGFAPTKEEVDDCPKWKRWAERLKEGRK